MADERRGRLIPALVLAAALCAAPAWAGVLDELGDTGAVDHMAAGMAAHGRGDHRAAIERYTQALDSGSLDKSNRAIAYNNRANAYEDLGDLQSALADYDQAIRLDAALVEAYYNRAYANYRMGRFDAALGDYDRAIILEPGNASAYFNRSFAWAAKGVYAKAVADVEKAIALSPNNAKYRDQLADWKAARSAPKR